MICVGLLFLIPVINSQLAIPGPGQEPPSPHICRVQAFCNNQSTLEWKEIDMKGFKGDTGLPGKRGPIGSMGRIGPIGRKGQKGEPRPNESRTLSEHENRIRSLESRLDKLIGNHWISAYRANNGYKYVVLQHDVGYENGKTLCMGIGGQPAFVGMRSQNSFRSIRDHFGDNLHQVSIGLTDQNEEGTFVWEDGLAASWGWINWSQGEPNNNGNEDCTQVEWYGQWNDRSCSGVQKILCEKLSVM